MFRPSILRAGAALGTAFGAGWVANAAVAHSQTLLATSSEPGSPLSFGSPATCSGASGSGEISTHVISKLGKPSVAQATVRVYHHPDFGAGCMSKGWLPVRTAKLSDNGGVDDLVPPGSLKRGLYLIEYDFAGVDAAARQIYRKEATGTFSPLNPSGFFLGAKATLTLKVEDVTSNNHLVLSVGDKELVARPGVRAH